MSTINELQQKLADLQAELDELKTKTDPAKWQPKGGKWRVSASGGVHHSFPTNEAVKNFGLQCATEQDAEELSPLVRSYARLFQWVKEHENPEWEADWSDSDQKKCKVFYNHNNNHWQVSSAFSVQEPSVIYMSRPTAQKLQSALEAGLVL